MGKDMHASYIVIGMAGVALLQLDFYSSSGTIYNWRRIYGAHGWKEDFKYNLANENK
jgi:hypothetical protein